MKKKFSQHIGIGAFVAIIGVVLMMFTQGITTPVVELSKVGLVLVVVGFIELIYELWRMMVSRRHG